MVAMKSSFVELDQYDLQEHSQLEKYLVLALSFIHFYYPQSPLPTIHRNKGFFIPYLSSPQKNHHIQ